MRRYIAKRLLAMAPMALGVSLIIFTLMRVLPGDIALIILAGEGSEGSSVKPEEVAALRESLGLDRPLAEQYATWIWGLVRLDAGKSLWYNRPVFEEIGKRLPISLELALLSAIVSLAIAIPIGTISAMRQDAWVDYVFRIITIGGISMPTFWAGTLIMLALVIFFGWMPPLGFTGPFQDPLKNLQQLIWPALALGYYFSAVVSRMMRSCMLEVLRQDYIRTAWSKGLRERIVIIRHALKNALLPVVTIVGVQVGHLIGGTVVMEQIFVLPGMGNALLDAISRRDYPVVQTIIVLMALMFLVVNLVVDLLYGWLDPRIRYE